MGPEREQHWTFGGGAVFVREVAPRLLLIRMCGYYDDVRIVEAFDEWYAKQTVRGPFDLYWDTSETTGYKTECRERLQHWQKRMMPTIRSSTVFVYSKVLAMAIAVTNMILGNLHRVTSNRSEFEVWLEQARRHTASSEQ